tara:strand:+ start:7193 stop:8116 length:924 start_codon:yes stop_codon:yes gene_type:complete
LSYSIQTATETSKYSPNTIGSFGSLDDTIKVWDANGNVIKPGLADVIAELPSMGSLHADTSSYANYRVRSLDITQGEDGHLVMAQVGYSNEPVTTGKDSSDPQSTDIEQAGFCDVTQSNAGVLVDIWRVESQATPFACTNINGNITVPGSGPAEELRGVGNVDAGGEPISQLVNQRNISVSLTRDTSTDIAASWWANIEANTHKRNSAEFMGIGIGKVLFTGARVQQTFSTGLVNYSLNFVAEEYFHLRQRVDKNQTGRAYTQLVSGLAHASKVYVLQPFPIASTGWGGGTLLTNEELTLLNTVIAD